MASVPDPKARDRDSCRRVDSKHKNSQRLVLGVLRTTRNDMAELVTIVKDSNCLEMSGSSLRTDSSFQWGPVVGRAESELQRNNIVKYARNVILYALAEVRK